MKKESSCGLQEKDITEMQVLGAREIQVQLGI